MGVVVFILPSSACWPQLHIFDQHFPSADSDDLDFNDRESGTLKNFIKNFVENCIRMSRLIAVVGDSNVRRNMTSLNIASREAMKSAKVIDCASLSTLEASLLQVPQESNVCILAVITDFLLANGDCGTINSSINPVLDTFSKVVTHFCNARQDLQV